MSSFRFIGLCPHRVSFFERIRTLLAVLLLTISNLNNLCFHLQRFQGNNDSRTVATRQFMKHVLARFIRIHPVSWVGHVCMRVDIRSRGMYNATTESVYSKTTRNETVEKSSKVVICFLKIL